MKKSKLFVICLLLLAFGVLAVYFADTIEQKLYPREYAEYVSKYSAEYGVEEALIYAVILTESGFDADARSSAGAVGLMQLMPDTLDWLSRLMGEKEPTGDISDPETNIKYGTYYLHHLINRFDDKDTAIAAYNAGHGRVANWLNDTRYSDDGKTLKHIPLDETDNYVNRVNTRYEKYIKIYYNGEE